MRIAVVVLVCALAGAALARPPDFAARAAVQESLRQVPPKWRGDWLRRRGIDWPGYTSYRQPDTGQGLRLIGKWGRGRACEVDGQDSIVALALGSEGISVTLTYFDEDCRGPAGLTMTRQRVRNIRLSALRGGIGLRGWLPRR